MTLTYDMAMAAGRDAANRRMRAAGRKTWSRADYNAAWRVTNRLLDTLPVTAGLESSIRQAEARIAQGRVVIHPQQEG